VSAALSIPTATARADRARRAWRIVLAATLMGALVVGSAILCRVDVVGFLPGLFQGLSVLRFFFPPDVGSLAEMVGPALVTLLLAAVATPFGVALSILFGLAGAANLSPAWLRAPARGVIAVERALPEIVVLLLLVAALGVGPFPGVVTLAIGSVGMLGRLFADAIEEIDARVIESVACVGASRWQVVRYAVLPEVMPSFLANAIFRFEINLRASVLLGAVGAGGIGLELQKAMALLEYERAMMAVLVTLALVFGAERISDFLRRRVLEKGGLR
jgi:phosphonate transport system permease protein